MNDIMTVTVMYRGTWQSGSWFAYPVTVKISGTCPVCGGKRGEPKPYNFCEDGEWFCVDKWENPCGHIDRYAAVLKEAGFTQ